MDILRVPLDEALALTQVAILRYKDKDERQDLLNELDEPLVWELPDAERTEEMEDRAVMRALGLDYDTMKASVTHTTIDADSSETRANQANES